MWRNFLSHQGLWSNSAIITTSINLHWTRRLDLYFTYTIKTIDSVMNNHQTSFQTKINHCRIQSRRIKYWCKLSCQNIGTENQLTESNFREFSFITFHCRVSIQLCVSRVYSYFLFVFSLHTACEKLQLMHT